MICKTKRRSDRHARIRPEIKEKLEEREIDDES